MQYINPSPGPKQHHHSLHCTRNCCTANDTGLAAFAVREIVDGCTSPNDTFTAKVVATTKSTAATRYDIGIWVNLDGTDAINGNQCYRQILTPVIPNPWLGVTINGGPYFSYDGDMCGDIRKNDLTVAYLPALTFSCSDPDGDGFVDVSGAVSWQQNKNDVCSSVLDAIPGTQSKCRSNSFRVDVSVPDLALSKSCTPELVLPGEAVKCTVSYTNSGKGDAVGFSLVDNYDQSNGAVSAIGAVIGGGVCWLAQPASAAVDASRMVSLVIDCSRF